MPLKKNYGGIFFFNSLSIYFTYCYNNVFLSLQHIKTLNVNNTICLAGYSFGGSVAFEMCLQAERNPQQHPKIRNLIMLDGSPALVTAYTREHKSHFQSDSIVEEEAQALCSYVLQFVDINMMEVS